MKKNVKSGLAEVAFEQLNIAFNPSTEHSQEQVEVSTDTSEQVKLEHSIDEKEICRYYIHEYKITQSDNCCYAVLHYLSNYDLPDEALHDLIVWRSHDYANILIDLADGLFNVFGSSFEHIKTTTLDTKAPHGKRVDDLLFHTVEIID